MLNPTPVVAPPDEEDAVVDAIEQTVDSTPVINEVALETDAKEMFRFVEDVAQDIHPKAVIARRYGFTSLDHMHRFLLAHPAVVKRIKAHRAWWLSDENIQVRLRALSGHALLEALPETAQIMFDPTVPASTRLDAMKAHARVAGVDGLPPQSRDGGGGGGATFSVVFNLGEKTQRVAFSGAPPVIEATNEPG